MKRKLAWSAIIPILALSGCSGQDEPAATNPASGATGAAKTTGARLHIAVIPKLLNNPVFTYPKIGAERAAKQLGNVDIEFVGPEKEDAAEQANIIDSMVAKKVSGILISCSDPEVPRRSIDKAVAAGIPVVTFDSDSPKSKRSGYYGVNDAALGKRLAHEMGQLLNGKGTVAILSGGQGALNLQNRDKGVRDELTKFPGIKALPTYYCLDDAAKSAEIVTNVTHAQKPDGWIFVGGWPLFTSNGLKAIVPGKTKVVSPDPLPETWPWIEKNYVQVCLGQKVFGWGEEGVKLLVRAINGEKIPVFNDSGFDVVTPQSLAVYKEQWAAMSKQP